MGLNTTAFDHKFVVDQVVAVINDRYILPQWKLIKAIHLDIESDSKTVTYYVENYGECFENLILSELDVSLLLAPFSELNDSALIHKFPKIEQVLEKNILTAKMLEECFAEFVASLLD